MLPMVLPMGSSKSSQGSKAQDYSCGGGVLVRVRALVGAVAIAVITSGTAPMATAFQPSNALGRIVRVEISPLSSAASDRFRSSWLFLTQPSPGAAVSPRAHWRLSATAADNEDADSENDVQAKMEELQNQLSYIEALEERNLAQLDSFVDEEDQWESMEDFERELLLSKDDTIKELERLCNKGGD